MNKTRVRKGSVTMVVKIIQVDKKKEAELNSHPQPKIFRGGWGTTPARAPTQVHIAVSNKAPHIPGY